MSLLNKLVVATLPAVPRPIVRYFANRYIAGEETADAVRVVKELNAHGVMATLDVLGEDIHSRQEAAMSRDTIIEVLQTIDRERLNSNVSIKLTQLGLKLDKTFCLENARTIAAKAKGLNNFIRIDMEDSSCTDDTIWVYRELRKSFSNVGIVLQAYLRRTEEDAKKLIAEGLKNFRLCKGIYIEPESIAFKGRDEVNRNFIRVLEVMLKNNSYVGIATHDQVLVDAACGLIADCGLRPPASWNSPRRAGIADYEFQMLLGVRSDLRSALQRDGHRLRVYVPFGKHWYKYSLRRFKENPQVAGYVLKALFTRNHIH